MASRRGDPKKNALQGNVKNRRSYHAKRNEPKQSKGTVQKQEENTV